MWETVDAEIDVSGNVRLLENVSLAQPSRALVTILSDQPLLKKKGNATELLAFLQENRLPEESRYSAEEIEAQIMEARDSWD